MPTDTPPTVPSAPPAPLTGAAKSAATVQRNREAARNEKLRDMQAQIAEGTLVVRYL